MIAALVGFVGCLREFWTRPLPARPAALLRIALASVALVDGLITIGPNLELFVGPQGLIPRGLSQSWCETRLARPSPLHGHVLPPALSPWLPDAWQQSLSHAADSAHVAWAVLSIRCGALALLLLGVAARPAAAVAWLMSVFLYDRLSLAYNGGDALLTMGLFFLILIPSGRAWSLAGTWGGTPLPNAAEPAPTIPAWSWRLMQIQLATIYIFTGLEKFTSGGLDGPNEWLDGSALYWILNDVCVTRWSYEMAPFPLWLLALTTQATLTLELFWGWLIWWPPMRPWLLTAGVMLHAAIWIMMEVVIFSPAILAWYPVFVADDWLPPRPAATDPSHGQNPSDQVAPS